MYTLRFSDNCRFQETVVINTSSDNIPLTKVKFESAQSVKKFGMYLSK